MNIIVTTPKSEIATSNKELDEIVRNGGYFFRTYHFRPKVEKGDKLYEVENSFIVGYGIIFDLIKLNDSMVCSTTEREYGLVGDWVVKYNNWHNIEPIKYSSFQGLRYTQNLDQNLQDSLKKAKSSRPITDNTLVISQKRVSKPCNTEGCGHNSRDHQRSKKINGIWTGKCTVPFCICEVYT